MKKYLALLLAGVMLLSYGCASGSGEPAASSGSAPTGESSSAEPEQDAQGAPQAETDPYDFSSAKVDWKKFDGDQIRAMLCKHWFSDAIVAKLEEFQALTGITVNYEQIPESDYANKLLIEFNSGANPPDVFMENYAWLPAHFSGGWNQDLNSYIENTELTDPDFFKFDDFMPSAINYCEYKDTLPGLPVTGEWQILYYRKDLLEQKGIAVPQTFQELYDAAVKLNDPQSSVSGFVSRLKRGVGTAHVFGGYLYSMGGEWITVQDDGSATVNVNTPEGVKAAEYYTSMFKDAGPMGAVNYGWSEAVAEMQSGKAAMMIDANGFRGQVEDPETSAVAGKIGYAPFPGDGSHPAKVHLNHWMLGLSSLGKNKEAGWYFLQWATSLPVAEAIALDNGNGARSSIWENADFIARYGQDYIEACQKSAECSERYIVPQIVEQQEVMDIIESGLHEIYGGANAQAVMDEVQAKTQAVLQQMN